MYGLADPSPLPRTAAPDDPIERELETIEDLRRRVLANRDILYCSAAARHLIEEEIPRLIETIRKLRRAGTGPADAGTVRRYRALLDLLREHALELPGPQFAR